MTDEDRRPPGLLGRLGGLAGEVGNAAITSVDPDLVVRQIDVNALLERVDVDELLDRVDVDRLLDRVDVNRLLDRVDVDRLLDRVDVDRLVQRADIEQVARRANTGILGAGGSLDVVRRQIVGVDTVVTRSLRRLFGRSTGEDRDGDPENLAGDPAGLLTRVLAVGLDLTLSLVTFTVMALLLSTGLGALLGRDGGLGLPQGLWFVGLAVAWTYLVTAMSLGALGRTPGMLLVGLRVQSTRDGDDVLHPGQAFLRTTVQALDTALFGIGYAWVLFDPRRRALHDVAADTELVHEWGGREARVATPIGSFLRDR